MKQVIVLAGATGNLGERIANALLDNGAEVRAMVRAESDVEKILKLEQKGVKVIKIINWSVSEILPVCEGASCVVSALAGLRDVIIDAQKILLDAAIAAKVPRFIPSDYSLDFTRFSYSENRNLDWRREFHEYLDKMPIAATTIFNGAFTDMLTGQMPLILFKQRLILYWGNADREWAFTTIQNTAEYTAKVAMDSTTPRYLHIAGDQVSPRQLQKIVSEITGEKFRLFRAGGIGLLGFIIKIARKFSPGTNELYPAWQGMQYMSNMIDDRSKLTKLDNIRYPELRWITAKDVLRAYEVVRNNVGDIK